MVQVFEHAPLANDVADAFRAYDCDTTSARGVLGGCTGHGDEPSSLRMYLSAKVRPVSLRSTMRTLPNAPLPTTRSSRKWLRFTDGVSLGGPWMLFDALLFSQMMARTLVGKDDGLAVALTHWMLLWQSAWRVGMRV